MGPTASGKTELAVRLAQVLGGEVISVDSALVYRGLNIGAAKPTREEMDDVPHHLLDIRDPEQAYSVADFCSDVKPLIHSIIERGRVPILAGGTMLYFKALLQGLSPMPPANEVIRADIEREAQEAGWQEIHRQLAEVDPLSASKIHPNHSQRLSRALEVWRISGKPISEWQTGFEGGLLEQFEWKQLAIAPRDRSVLHARIAKRFDLMLDQGFLNEVRELKARIGCHKDLPAIRAVGYRQVWAYLEGECTLDEAREKAIVATRQLAKRQLTWLRAWPNLKWLDTLQENEKKTVQNKQIDEILQECVSFCRESAI